METTALLAATSDNTDVSWSTIIGILATILLAMAALGFKGIRSDVKTMKTELTGAITNLTTKMEGEFKTIRTEIESQSNKLTGQINTLTARMEGEFNTVNAKIDGIDKRMSNLETVIIKPDTDPTAKAGK